MVKLSIVIVAYKNMDCLADCLASIPTLPWIEVVVVNNTHQNRGFGKGCNVGSAHSSGTYVLFLNPDCIVTEEALRGMIAILDKDKTIGVLGPQLTNRDGVPYLSCNRPASRWLAPWVYSVFNTWFRRFSAIADYWYHHQPPKQATEVGSCCGAALMMKRALFQQIKGFDEDYFLYWEEFDLQKRISDAGYRIVFDPRVSLVHVGELSTLEPRAQIMKWFRQSRYLFFKKHFGLWYAALLEGWFTCLEEWRLLLTTAFLLGVAWISYEQMWWMHYGQLWMWDLGKFSAWISVSNGFWLSVAGAVMGMIAFYNELSMKRKNLAIGLSLLVGILLLAGSPTSFLVTILAGLGWILADLQLHNPRWRKLIVRINVGIVFGLVVWPGILTLQHQSPIYSKDWREAAQVIARYEKSNVSLRCVGCDDTYSLSLLTLLLHERGIMVRPNSSVVYVVLPPFSSYQGRIPDTFTYQFDSLIVAIPFVQP